MLNILVVDDDKNTRLYMSALLERAGYTVSTAENGARALKALESTHADLIVLDVMMPGLDGVTLLKRLRSNGIKTPALFLTARSEIDQRIEGLDAGADDYLPKPFSTGELLARVRAMLRRKDNYTPDLLSFGSLLLNRSTYEIIYNDESKTLSGKEFQVIEMLMQNPNNIVTAEQLITHIWGWDASVDTSVVWVHISNIRKKIDSLGALVSIKFVRNVGYILEANS